MSPSEIPDHYATLGVPPAAGRDEIVRAYRALARRYHPDHHEGNELRHLAEAKLTEINHAYAVLSDPARRADYDARRGISPGWEGGGFPPQGGSPPAGEPLRPAEAAARWARTLLIFLLVPVASWFVFRVVRSPRIVLLLVLLLLVFWVLPRWMKRSRQGSGR